MPPQDEACHTPSASLRPATLPPASNREQSSALQHNGPLQGKRSAISKVRHENSNSLFHDVQPCAFPSSRPRPPLLTGELFVLEDPLSKSTGQNVVTYNFFLSLTNGSKLVLQFQQQQDGLISGVSAYNVSRHVCMRLAMYACRLAVHHRSAPNGHVHGTSQGAPSSLPHLYDPPHARRYDRPSQRVMGRLVVDTLRDGIQRAAGGGEQGMNV